MTRYGFVLLIFVVCGLRCVWFRVLYTTGYRYMNCLSDFIDVLFVTVLGFNKIVNSFDFI